MEAETFIRAVSIAYLEGCIDYNTSREDHSTLTALRCAMVDRAWPIQATPKMSATLRDVAVFTAYAAGLYNNDEIKAALDEIGLNAETGKADPLDADPFSP